MKTIIKAGVILGVCAFLAIAVGKRDASEPTPVIVQDNDVELVKALGEIVQPIVSASANAQRADTSTAHPQSTAEQWTPLLVPLCVVSCVVAAFVIVAVVWILTRAGVLTRLVKALERMSEK